MVDSMPGLLEFYAQPGPLTAADEHRELDSLPAQLSELVDVIHGLGIYDVVAADFYGVDVCDARRMEIHCRELSEMLANIVRLDSVPLNEPRPAERRLLTRCGGYTRLLVGALRHQGVPARARCGFATYLNPGHFEDHWVGEVWDRTDQRWRLVDAQLDEVWRTQLHIDDDPLDLARDRFLTAADAWDRCRSGEFDSTLFGISFGGLHGMCFVAGNLVRDVAALNKFEMLPWDVWGSQPAPDEVLDDQRLLFFDELAALTQDPDTSFEQLRQLYASDERVRVPVTVFNALRRQHEAVETHT
jgi:Transglutaminase-like superfamily